MGYRRKFLCVEAVAGFAIGISAAYLLLYRSPAGNLRSLREVIANTVCDSGHKEENEIKGQNWTRVPSSLPSLQQDWGNVNCSRTALSPDSQNLFDYISKVTLICDKQVMIGGQFNGDKFDGEKWCCLDKLYNIKRNNCTVLSFGISSDWSFDDGISALLNCKVHAFDPTIGRQNHQRSPNIRFYNMGISDAKGTLQAGTVERYVEILRMLHLENSEIDYLKIDVEGSEFKFFKDVLAFTPNLLKKVKQIGMELHLNGHHPEAWYFFQQLDCLGFKVMFINFNPFEVITQVNGKRRSAVYEIVWGQDRQF